MIENVFYKKWPLHFSLLMPLNTSYPASSSPFSSIMHCPGNVNFSRYCARLVQSSDTLSSSWCTSLPKRFSINSRLSDPSRWQCNSILGNAISSSCVVMFLHFVCRIYFSKCLEKGFMPGSLDRIPVAAALSGYKYHNVPYPLPKQS